jgi:uncharacterized RDD family membrane protein YckC
VTAPENPPRWAADPLGRHQYRYWDGAQWSEHVSDNGLLAVDPPTVTPPPTAGSLPAPLPGTAASAYARPPGAAALTGSARRDPTAVLGRRYGAFLIDAVVCVIAFVVFLLPFATERTRAETLRLPGCHLSTSDSSRVECDNRVVFQVNDTVYEANGGAFIALSILFTFLYFAVMEGFTGGSLGKHLTGTRVVAQSGERPGIWLAGVRWLLFVIDGPLTLFLCGIITSSVSRGHRRLGDMAAGTYVVGRDDAGHPVVID